MTDYYINFGNNEIAGWETYSPYVIVDGTGSSTYPEEDTTNAPSGIYVEERYGSGMTLDFPVTEGIYIISLYVMEGFSGNFSVGSRVFDVSVNGVVPTSFENIDPYAIARKGRTPKMVQARVSLPAGTTRLVWIQKTENPNAFGLSVVELKDTRWKTPFEYQGNAVSRTQDRVIKVLLPDICNIQPANLDNKTVNRYGIEEGDEPNLRTYNGNADIPCRADAQRSFRPDDLDYQASQVDEVDLHLPHDVTIVETDIVILNSNKYKIRKLVDDSEWDLTKVVKIMRVTTTGVLS